MYKLSEKYEILYITTRPESVKFATETYLRRYKYPNYNDLTMSKDKELDVQLMGCDYFVEDMPHHARKLKNITNVILFRRPYNLGAECEFENCICNLQELERILL